MILELNEGSASTLVKFEYQYNSSKIHKSFEKKQFPTFSIQRKTPLELEVKFMFKSDQLGGKGVVKHIIIIQILTLIMLENIRRNTNPQ